MRIIIKYYLKHGEIILEAKYLEDNCAGRLGFVEICK